MILTCNSAVASLMLSRFPKGQFVYENYPKMGPKVPFPKHLDKLLIWIYLSVCAFNILILYTETTLKLIKVEWNNS